MQLNLALRAPQVAKHVEYLLPHFPALSWDKALRKVSAAEREAAKWLLTKVSIAKLFDECLGVITGYFPWLRAC